MVPIYIYFNRSAISATLVRNTSLFILVTPKLVYIPHLPLERSSLPNGHLLELPNRPRPSIFSVYRDHLHICSILITVDLPPLHSTISRRLSVGYN